MMRALFLAVLVAACTDASTVVDDGVTAVEVTVQLDPSLGIDQLRISSIRETFAPGTLPPTPRPLGTGESFVVLVPDDLDGTEIIVRVDGEAGGEVVASGATAVVVRARTLVKIEVLLGEPAICGDSIIREGVEECDDGSAAAPGCSDACVVEDGYVCTNDEPSICMLDTFDVVDAVATGNHGIAITFSAPPDAAAVSLASYSVPGLTLVGTPAVVDSTVLIETATQSTMMYTVTVSGVARALDAMPLVTSVASFNGVPLMAPTVTNVEVISTAPDNGIVPYNTGDTTVTITGTDLVTVTCPGGVRLADRDGGDVAVNTVASSCTVLGDSQITATFPAGIRTNGATGWNVIVTNQVGSNATSAVPFAPAAGLVISEVYIANPGGGGNPDHEFVELYNRTDQPIDVAALRLHTRDAAGNDSNRPLAFTNTSVVAHGFVMLGSAESDAGDEWFAHQDATFAASLVANGGAYISLSDTAQRLILDKVGWGSQAAGGREGTGLANAIAGQSASRKPAAGAGHGTDTDNNLADFNMFTNAITPRGTLDSPQP